MKYCNTKAITTHARSKSRMILMLAAVCASPLAAFADGFVPSRGDASFLWEGPRYERVDGAWKRVDVAPADADRSMASRAAGSAKPVNAQTSSLAKDAMSIPDTRFDNRQTTY
jgi:hypothetical protein